MQRMHGIRRVGAFDCPGGGQVVVENGVAFIGHMEAPAGTSIVDVSDPRNPRLLAQLEVPAGTHSHKVRVAGDLMLVNHELHTKSGKEPPSDFLGGYSIYDISTPSRPRSLFRWEEKGRGVHRFDFDGRYGYLSPTLDGYLGNILMIVDFDNPERPQEVGRWWEPGQWIGGGEEPSWEGTAHRCHHPLRLGNRLYTSYWMAGAYIIDIEDMSRPKVISHQRWSPPFNCPVHTALPLPFEIGGRKMMVVAEEDVVRNDDQPPAAIWMVDITDERHPFPIASYQVKGLEGTATPTYTACHQPSEKLNGVELPVAYFAQGLRVLDLSQPRVMAEVAYYLPDPAPGYDQAQSNDVTVDDRGLIYLLDRHRGLEILERTGGS